MTPTTDYDKLQFIQGTLMGLMLLACIWIGVAVIVLTSCTTPSGYTNWKPYKQKKGERIHKTGYYHKNGRVTRKFFSNF